MKIAMTLEVPDSARGYIAKLADGEATLTGMATREAVIAFLQATVASLDDAFSGIPTGRLTDSEIAEISDAVDWLRRQGKTDAQIRAWLLMQRARLDVAKEAAKELEERENS